MLSASLAMAAGAAPKSKAAHDAPPAAVAASAAAPGAPASAGDPLLGRDKADAERCLECHSDTGAGQGFSTGSDGKFAQLNGQDADYIVKQVRDYRSGQRRHEFMTMVAQRLSDADLADIAAYFASQPALHASASGAETVDAAARRLYAQGDATRGVLACASCHGAEHHASGAPVLGGQGRGYLAQQLADWRSGARGNSAGGVMNLMAAPLSDADIAALARYVSAM